MLEREFRLTHEGGAKEKSRQFLHTQLVGDVLSTVDLDEHRYLIVVDGLGAILGVVETEELLKKVASPDPVERRRWYEMPLESTISARLDSYSPGHRQQQQSDSTNPLNEFFGTTISSGDDDLAAIFLEDELYLRWSSVKQILQHALVDPVTGLANRMVFERRLAEEWQRLDRVPSSICVILIDLDYFKSVNDQFGHAVGDVVLEAVGKTLQHQLRSYDLLVRYGGDEFAAVLTGCTASQLAIPVGRIQSGIQNLSLEGYPDLPDLSLSVGAVTFCSQLQAESIDDLICKADACLYRAKDHGRGCAFLSDLSSEDSTPVHVDSLVQSMI
ncbi:GGDEF domain-containing protein [Thalassoglobus polymorphus]|uniref:diguanylate cyclase n=1 Tax=Thalassoglobus polymorphus TaxID=2527994 RepID=A0A517QS94_9PLAN|nr:GGDEF domain-containing protein [Thalassoglobus polymorphus]QDT34494.1 putative diguanylate cyclase AdrA [Thalassoglobus polymorphus]